MGISCPVLEACCNAFAKGLMTRGIFHILLCVFSFFFIDLSSIESTQKGETSDMKDHQMENLRFKFGIS